MIAAASQVDGQAFLGITLLVALLAMFAYMVLGPSVSHRMNRQRQLPHRYRRAHHSTVTVAKRKYRP